MRRPRFAPALERLEARDLLHGTLASIGLTPGWATFGQALPCGQAWDYLQLGELPTQTDVKNRCADGSIKFAVVTAYADAAGTYALTQGSPPAEGAFPPPPDAHAVALSTGETDWWAANADPAEAESVWLAGWLVTETRKVVTPSDHLGRPHPFLRVVFDERFYRDGSKRLDVTVENSRHSAGSMVWYVPALYADGSQVWGHTWVGHGYLTRWRQAVSFGTFAEVVPDFAPAVAAKAIPSYWQGVANLVYAPGGPDFDILGKASLNPFMPDHGGREELAPLPDWTARYLVHKNPTQKAFVLAHGDLAGSWPVHVREDDFSVLTIDSRPNYWLDPRALPPDRPQGDLSQRGPLVPDNAHQPSLAYVPYLATGDRYYADELAAWANYVLLVTFQDSFYNCRGGSVGYLWCNETRGMGWGLRNMVHGAAYLPDADPMKEYLAAKVRNNLAAFDVFAATQQSAYGVSWHGVHAWEDGYDVVTLWGHEFVALAIAQANALGFAGGTRWRDQIGRFQVGWCADPQFRDGCAPYRLRLWRTGGGPPLMTYADAYTGPTAFQGYYGPDARLMVVLGLELGWAGSQAAYDYLNPVLMFQPYWGPYSDLGQRAGWALEPNP